MTCPTCERDFTANNKAGKVPIYCSARCCMRAVKLRRYSLTQQDYNRMLEAQGGKCRICKRNGPLNGRSLDVDHDHKTGRVRGLLCPNCNSHLGWYERHKDVIDDHIKETPV